MTRNLLVAAILVVLVIASDAADEICKMVRQLLAKKKDEAEQNGLEFILKDGMTLLVKSWNRDIDIIDVCC